MPTSKVANIPLRLRRRRDGSLALTGANGGIDDPDREFPNPCLFLHTTLLDSGGAMSLSDDRIVVELANARAVYERVDPVDYDLSVLGSAKASPPSADAMRAQGVFGVLVESELFAAPDLKES